MFGFGKKKISAAHAVQAFIEVGTNDAGHNFVQWGDEMIEHIERFKRDATPLKLAMTGRDDAVLLFAGTMMAGSLMAPRNLFNPPVVRAIYAETMHQLGKSTEPWLGDFIFGILKQAQASPGHVAFPSFALVKELRVEKYDADLERFMLGPIFLLALADYEMRLPILTFWKRLFDQMLVTA